MALLKDTDLNFPLLTGFLAAPPLVGGLPAGYGHDTDYVFWCSDPSLTLEQAFQGTVFTDGSCQNLGPRQWHLATWSVIAQDPAGSLTAFLSGAVGKALPQTSAAAEYVAGLAVSHHCSQTDTLYSDYMSLAGIEQLDTCQLCYSGNYYSGIRCMIRSGRAWQPQSRVIKVKAHQDLEALDPVSLEWWMAKGNDHADRIAKQAAERFGRPSPAERDIYRLQEEALESLLRYASEALQLWDTALKGKKRKARPKPLPSRRPSDSLRVGLAAATEMGGPWAAGQVLLSDRQLQSGYSVSGRALLDTKRPGGQQHEGESHTARDSADVPSLGGHVHDWALVADRWICRTCLRRSRSLVKPSVHGCPGRNQVIHSLWQRPQGHELAMARTTVDEEVVVICQRCGYYTEGVRAVRLAEPCGGVKTRVSQATWNRLVKLKHPNTRRGTAKVMEPALIPLSSLVAE